MSENGIVRQRNGNAGVGNPAWGSKANGTGKSGNPKGPPLKDVCLTSLLKQYLLEVPDLKIGGQTNTRTWRELIAQAWLVGAYKGNSVLFKELLDRVDGKVTLPIGGENGQPIKLEVTGLLEKLQQIAGQSG